MGTEIQNAATLIIAVAALNQAFMATGYAKKIAIYYTVFVVVFAYACASFFELVFP